MCEPTTIMAVTAAVSAGLTMQQQRAQGKFQRGTAEYNARVAENEAQETRNVGVERENIQRRKTAELISKQRAQLGASGIELGSGSALQLQEDAQLLGEVDALRIRSNFQNRADALDTGSLLTRRQGVFAQAASRNAMLATGVGAVGSVIDTGVADKWLTPNSAAVTA